MDKKRLTMKKTPLHAIHIALNAKMGEFAGYDMPLYYEEGVVKEHEWVRSQAGLFDVSHMGQITLTGQGATAFLEKITPSTFTGLPAGRAKYTVLTNEKGGIIDDLIVTRRDDENYFAVINAGCKDKDIDWIKKNLPAGVKFENLSDRALIALQGPAAEGVLREVLKIDASGQPYMWLEPGKLPDGTEIFVSRVGYTGEDGFELSVPPAKAEQVWKALSAHRAVRPVGLAARDSLRLEMGYCLYGHDIDQDTTPVEAGLTWVIGKNAKGYNGAAIIISQLEKGTSRQRVGVRLLDKGIAREGAEITDGKGKAIGKITSGSFSPTLRQAIGIGYVDSALSAPGNKIAVVVRDRAIVAEIAPMPFVPAKTKAMKKQAA
jgi:aminomethyltransferase